MKNKILRVLKKIFNPTIFLAIIFGLFFYHLNSGIMDIDDIVYRNAFNSFQTFLEWVHDFYNVWSGRITLTLLITVFTNIPIVFFKLFNVICG